MKPKNMLPFLIIGLMISTVAESQAIILRPGRGYYGYKHKRFVKPQPLRERRVLPIFEPTINISAGYGFPDLDKNYLPQYTNAYKGNITQTGPVVGSIDYRFSRNMSIGATVTHGVVTAPYYGYGNTGAIPDFNVKLDSWSFMLNLKSYMQAGEKVSPYLRTSIGINNWKQYYTDGGGNKINMPLLDLPDLAYQASIGADFKLSKNAAFYAEAGYGKYILQGGLMLKF